MRAGSDRRSYRGKFGLRVINILVRHEAPVTAECECNDQAAYFVILFVQYGKTENSVSAYMDRACSPPFSVGVV